MVDTPTQIPTRFSRVLVANRGEIACRIIRTLKENAYTSIAVFTDVDAQAPHVRDADVSVRIGAGPVADSYLSIERVIAAAKSSGAQAVHPGYGFLSENADFARACEAAGLVFIGPGADAIELMGNKALAKAHMLNAGVACVPGYQGSQQCNAGLSAEARKIGLPLMIKAAAGGGGRGMRLLEDFDLLAATLDSARAEAEQAFGSGELILERAVQRARHVEVQIFADVLGHTISLGERDCSVQRRHQKILEEAPCPVLSPEIRQAMGEAAIAAAKSVNYRGAGTVEFLLDRDGAFYFLEMNTRLQVEHPVTECVTGLDLVNLQLQVAQGEPLGLDQEDVRFDGHAIEARLYSEDPATGFLPTTGEIVRWQAPAGEGIRVDSGIETGVHISAFYDPLLAKVIAWGHDREEARQGLLCALQATTLFGLRSNIEFLIACLQDATFSSGDVSTAFVSERFNDGQFQQSEVRFEQAAVAALIQHVEAVRRAASQSVMVAEPLFHFCSSYSLSAYRHYQILDRRFELCIRHQSANTFEVTSPESRAEIVVDYCDKGRAEFLLNGQELCADFMRIDDASLWLKSQGLTCHFVDQLSLSAFEASEEQSGSIRAPMHGQITDVYVNEGEGVRKGQVLLRMEAMKMQHEIVANADGRVREVKTCAGAQVAADALLLTIASLNDAG